MAHANPVRYTLADGTTVIVKKVANNKYDFELKLTNGNRKTFVWEAGNENEFSDKNGSKDALIAEAVKQFKEIE